MSWSFPIGRLLGSELRVHYTFLLLLAFIGGSAWMAAGPSAAVINVIYVLALFACVIAHEYGHALTARAFGIPTPDITLLPIGGLARLQRIPDNPVQEILVALAGPAVNVVIFGILFLMGSADFNGAPLGGGMTLAQLPAQIALLNLILAGFNMIPAFPMDGGRVLRAVLSLMTTRVTATRIAALIGQTLAIGFGIYGLYIGSFIYPLIAVFIFMAARAEAQDVRLRDLARTARVEDVMRSHFTALSPTLTLDQAKAAFDSHDVLEFPVVDSATSRIVGFVTKKHVLDIHAKQGGAEFVGNVMARNVAHVREGQPLGQVLRLLQRASGVGVVTATGETVGYVTQQTVMEHLK
ncbi:site-2 protease family protein [Maritimibacter sp. DP1N21-5]|uniref:site-2 protease family protein n=1 Tax=Maritimibacter sp. DP1N21-5 TaxID=2836867 RepID=UPI001C440F94|nr:site-2 protease family protein [Maritimibacter sp. DP1N21-5]MBV7409779.1 site-2 protease family protein [Maritimibacter sp. DP1N21-5]